MSPIILVAAALMQLFAPSAARAPRSLPASVPPALERICQMDLSGPAGRAQHREAMSLGFGPEGGALTARMLDGYLWVLPGRDGRPCRIEGELPATGADALDAAFSNWARSRNMAWTKRDESGPDDGGGWARRRSRGDDAEGRLTWRLVTPATPAGEAEPGARARLEATWQPPA